MNDSPRLAFVVMAGPQASGKSTIAAALRSSLLERGERVALVALDGIAEMALPTLPSWNVAREILGSVATQWVQAGMTCVIAEGVGSAYEVADLLRHAPADAAIIRVAVTTPFEVAFARAQADPTRGVSRNRDFLSAVYERWQNQLATIDADVIIDTNERSVSECVAAICAVIAETRSGAPAEAPDRSRAGIADGARPAT